MKTYLELQEFFIEGKATDTSHVLLHITEPSTAAEFDVGYFFAIAEIIDGDLEYISHVQSLIDDLESGVYETDDAQEKSSFEVTLEYINRRGHHILNFDGTCSILVGVIRGNDISFAFHGSPLALLMYQTNGQYHVLDILDKETVSDTQLFSAVMEGRMNTGDAFFIATPRVKSIFSNDRLQKIITRQDSRLAAKHIEKIIRETETTYSYGGIIFETKHIDEKPHTGPRPRETDTNSAASMESLHATEISADALLHPSLLRRKKHPNTIERTTNERQRNHDDEELPLGNQILVVLGKAIVTILRFIFILFLKLFVIIKNGVFGAFILMTNIGGKRQYIIDDIKRTKEHIQRQYRSLPRISKILFFATLIFAVIFIGSILFLRYKEHQEAALANYVNTVSAIRDKTDAAEASLIYDDTNRSFTLLDEARAMLATLPEKTDDERLTKTTLSESIESIFTELRNMHAVPVTITANLAELGAQVTNLARVNNFIIAYGADDTNHYIINIDTGEVETRDHASIGTLGQADTPKENDYVTFLKHSGELATLDPETFIITSGSIGSEGSNTYTDLAIYNRRAYTLNTTTNQIYRHNPTLTGFDAGSPWLTDTVDLSSAIRITIDGDVFVLTHDGNILKFFGGAAVPFDLKGIDPPLQAPTDIWTYTDVPGLYILDPNQNRIILLDKDGTLDAQFTAVEWNIPEAMMVRDETNEVYVLDDNIVYRFSTRDH
jgi:cell division protein FtsL